MNSKDEKLQNRLKDLVSRHKEFSQQRDGEWSQSEAMYQSKFYKKYDSYLGKLTEVKKRFSYIVRANSNYVFTFIRALHSMLVDNQPAVTMYPGTSDEKDKDSALAADAIARYERKRGNLDSYISNQVLNTLLHGTGILKVYWDSEDGEYFYTEEKDKETDEIIQKAVYDGNVKYCVVNARNFFFDDFSGHWKESLWCLEKKILSKEMAYAKYPKFKDKLSGQKIPINLYDVNKLEHKKIDDSVILYEYWERKHPLNDMKGKYVVFTPDIIILEEKEHPYKHGKLPYVVFTDIDLPDTLWGKSIIELLKNPQKTVNRLMSQIIENINVHGVIRMAVPDTAGIQEKSITDKPIDLIKYSGNVPPTFIFPPSLPGHMFKAYEMLLQTMEHIAGLRAYSRGEMQKAVSGFAAQLMIEQDQKTHRQLHNKYIRAIEDTYRLVLSLCKQFWQEQRNITVLGEEKEYEYYKYKGAHIEGNYDVQVQYGTTLPTDPASRRQAIIELYREGLLEDKNTVLRLLELGDLAGVFDVAKNARKRQKEEIEIMKRNGINYGIRETEDHTSHLEEIYNYFQTKEFDMLDENLKKVMEEHSKYHEEALKQSGALGNQQRVPVEEVPKQ